MKKILAALLGLNLTLFAFSDTSLSVLYGNFDGNSAVFDTADGKGKTTLTLEHLTAGEMGSVFFFSDYCKASGGQLYNPTNKSWIYTEIAPRLSLSYLAGKPLGNSFIKEYYLSAQYNFGSSSDYEAKLVGFGLDLNMPGFDFFQADTYYKRGKLTIGPKRYTRDTFQETLVYGTHFGSTGITFGGFFDITGYSITTQNQLLYELFDIDGKPVQVGVEHEYYYEFKNDFTSHNPHVRSNVFQAMIKAHW